MMERWLLISLLLLTMVASAQTANKLGLQAEGVLVPGNTVIVGTTANDLKDGGPPGQNKTLSIGDIVNGATPNMCLTVDANGKLAQADCLLAH